MFGDDERSVRPFQLVLIKDTQRQLKKNICSEDDLRSRIFETFVVNFLLACLS